MNAPPNTVTRVIRWACVAMITAALCWGALGIVWILATTNFDEDHLGPVILTPVVAVIAACAILVSVAGIEKQRLVGIMWVAIGATTMSAAGWLLLTWVSPYRLPVSNVLALRCVGTITLIAMGLVICGQLLIHDTPSAFLTSARRLVVVITCAYLVCMIGLIWTERWHAHGEIVAIASTIAGMFVLIGLISVSLMVRLSSQRKSHQRESLPSRLRLRMTCPKCAHEQTLPMGLVKCVNCRFAMMIEVQEPRCECGYLLYQLQGDTCPECGRPMQALA